MCERTIFVGNPDHKPEAIQLHAPLVLRCIDFRTNEDTIAWLERKGLPVGSYHLYASAGASGNPNGLLETLKIKHPSRIEAVNHEDCGYYKLNGNDSPQNHHDNLQTLGDTIHAQNPDINYEYHLLPVEDQRKYCSTTVIMLGDPDIIKAALERMDKISQEEGTDLLSNCDIIARPYYLSPQDETIWEDQRISHSLHHTSRVIIFTRDETNAQALIERAVEIPNVMHIPEVEVIHIALNQTA